MTDEQKMAAIPPVVVTMIGDGTGDGGSPIITGTVGRTPDHQANLIVQVISPIVAILIRFANAYITTLVGLVTVGLTTDALPAADFKALVWRCAGLAIAGPCVSLAKDVITILGGLEKKFPLLTGNV